MPYTEQEYIYVMDPVVSGIEYIFPLLQWKNSSPLYLIFIDFERAVDILHHSATFAANASQKDLYRLPRPSKTTLNVRQ